MPLPIPGPSGWGLSPYGLFPYGFGPAGTLSITQAYATSERTVRVVLSIAPRAVSPLDTGDALNPKTWQVTRSDSGAQLLVLAAAQISTTVFDLYTLDKLGHALIQHAVSSTTLVDSSGGPITPPTSAAFAGCAFVPVTRAPTALLDLRNVSTSETSIGGVYEVGSDGDYTVHGGVEFLRKLIIRRLVTMPGEFFYLNSAYGIGFRVKEPLPGNDLIKLQVAIQQQLLREPEFLRVAVSLSLSGDNVLTIQVSAVLRRSNEEVVIPITAPGALVSL
jgi:hypothetical protein